MDFVSLIVLSEPSGMWETILEAFKSGVGSYVVAVILIAVIVRILLCFVDIVMKYVNLKNSKVTEKMKPEMDMLQKKYGHDKMLLQQKQSELYKKYQYNVMSSCLPMLLVMAIQLTIFLTLWSGLNAVADYNIVSSYEQTKSVYASIISLNEDDELKNWYSSTSLTYDTDYTIEITSLDFENGKFSAKIVKNEDNSTLLELADRTLYTTTKKSEDEVLTNYLDNESIWNLLENYVVVLEDDGEENALTLIEEELSLAGTISSFANSYTASYYTENMQGFIWIKNIYKADSPTTSPIITESEIKSYWADYYSTEEQTLEDENNYEVKIFGYVTTGLNEQDNGVNGYYILVVLAVLLSILSVFINSRVTKGNSSGTGGANGKMMYFIMPILNGLFALIYTSLFAIYIITGQLISSLLSPLNNLLARKWVEASQKKKQDKNVVEVDYRRKDI